MDTDTDKDIDTLTPPNPVQAAIDYSIDAWQRGVLYADVMRQRGNQYQQHLREAVPHVLNFEFEPVMSGRDLPRPVNYWLVRILPLEGVAIDPVNRPFVIVDPRAGHGPGVGGFKADSEIGVALRAGHAAYFVGFLPDPVEGQTVEDVMNAEAAFIEHVISLHPQSEGKPVVVANCQAGWQIMMTAAKRPELFGPIILAGTPLSYWSGWRGKNPMRYAGGLLGGSWLTALTGDMGAGRWDGAWLVQNFENLNPANTLWGKQYNLYANIDTEPERYLEFEQYWGGYVFLDAVEMQWLVDNLFVGNRLATAELITSDGIRLDFRNIRSPIVVFASMGDNITPPPQALGWITDLYRNDEDVLAHGQTIVYALHESIGHLGIFVSGSVGRKEHREFADNIDLIDVLPPGLYQAEVNDRTEATLNPELAVGDHLLSFQKRSLGDVREIVAPDPESDRRFATAARVSDANLGLYRTFVQPFVRATVTPLWAEWSQRLHPLRISYEMMSDGNPLSARIADAAARVREHRQPVPADNPFLRMQETVSQAIETTLDRWRDVRDQGYEHSFEAIYGMPWLQAMVGLRADSESTPRQHPGESPEHRVEVERKIAKLRLRMLEGGLREAVIRAAYFVARTRGEVDERGFNLGRKLREAYGSGLGLAEFKRTVREQAGLFAIDEAASMAALPTLLAGSHPAEIRAALPIIEKLLTVSGALTPSERQRFDEIGETFEAAAAGLEAAAGRGASPAPAPNRTRARVASAADVVKS